MKILSWLLAVILALTPVLSCAEDAADALSADALYEQAVALMEAEEPDYVKAEEYFLQAAELGNDDAMNSLGINYQNGNFNNGTPDGKKALEYYIAAWHNGYESAVNTIVNLFDKGIPAEDEEGAYLFEPDYASMLDFLKEVYAASTENTYALSWLGLLLTGSRNVCEPDYPRAVKVYTRGAELGDSYSMWQIGRIYETGHLGEVDLTAAEEWYLKAVEAGETRAQKDLDNLRAKLAE